MREAGELSVNLRTKGWLVNMVHRLAVALLLTVVIAATACTPKVEVHGFIPDDELVKQIKAGQHDRTYVEELLGSPSSIANFEGETWYYITRRTETLAFFEPEVKDQRVLAISFDLGTGTVKEIGTFNLADGRPIQFVERETPTLGKQLGFFEQLFGNVGRFSGTRDE